MGRRKQKKKAKRDARARERAQVRAEAPAEPVDAHPAEKQPEVEPSGRTIEIELEIEELARRGEPPLSRENEGQQPRSAETLSSIEDEAEVAARPERESALDLPAAREESAESTETDAFVEKDAIVEASGEVTAPAKSTSPRSNSLAPGLTAADRRVHPRYTFRAVAEVIATDSSARTNARVLDLSQQGCYLDTKTPHPLKTAVEVRITQSGRSMKAQARVVYSQPGKGMGLMFTSVEPVHNQLLYAWISESRETSWLAANRRRSQRVMMKLPVRLSTEAGAGFFEEEETYTLTISAHGALIASAAPLYRGQRVTLSNVQTKGSLECLVAHIDKSPGEQTKVGVEFLLPNPTFWHVVFPPKDWTPRHPDAKAR